MMTRSHNLAGWLRCSPRPGRAGATRPFVVGQDHLDLSRLFANAGYAGTDPFRDGYLSLSSDGAGGVKVDFDPDGPAAGNPWPILITTIDHKSLTAGTANDWLVFR